MFGDINPMASSYIGNIKNFGGQILIQKTITNSQSSIDFLNIPQDFNHLKFIMLARSSAAGTGGDNIGIRFNGDTGSNYQIQYIQGFNGTAAASNANQSFMYATQVSTAGDTANNPGSCVTTISFYNNTTFYKTCQTYGGHAVGTGNNLAVLHIGGWNSTASITSVTVFMQSGSNFVNGSLIYLYGMI